MKIKNYGFTLAEILIAITVIGVISAVTLPVLTQNTQKQEIITALKKTYSTLSQVTNQIIAEEGTPKSSCADCKDGWAYSYENIYNLYKKHMNNIKECDADTSCFAQFNGKDYKYLNGGSPSWASNKNLKRIITADGTQILWENLSPVCSGGCCGSSNWCAVFWVDINGEKKPNTIGRDMFLFTLKENGLFPFGCDDNQQNDCKKGGMGHGCACRVLKEGAINY